MPGDVGNRHHHTQCKTRLLYHEVSGKKGDGNILYFVDDACPRLLPLGYFQRFVIQLEHFFLQLLPLPVFFIAGNTIRLEIHDRRNEIIIAKLVGATNGFIQRPFLYTGFWIGFLSGVLAWFLVTFILLILRPAVENISGLYEGAFHLLFFTYSETFMLLLSSTGLAVVGSWLVLHFQIKQLRPE